MKKTAAILSLVGYATLVGTAFAAPSSAPVLNPGGEGFVTGNIEDFPSLIIYYLQYLAIILSVLYLMYGGIKLITAKGDTVAVQSARKHIFSAVTGLIVVLGVFVILNFVFRALGITNPLESGSIRTLNNVRGTPKPN